MGTSTSAEAKEYFTEMRRHRITFKYTGPEDDHAVKLAFSKKMVEQRKDWLTNGMEERKRRRELGLSEVYLYESNTRTVSYRDFVNKELILFSNMDNERSIPSMMDGLKPGQRKVIYTCFKRNDKREVKVAQLAGSVGEHSAYHHGEVSLMSTIINLAQNFVGSNNINLLQPIGQFGTRLQGGKDAASPRYIFTMLSPLARKLFPALDDPLLNNLYDDNLKIEPEYYVPVIPMVLVNGAEGIGTGWSTKIPNYNPREIVENIRRLIRGEEVQPMKPWFKGFFGSIVQIDTQRFVVNGEIALLDSKSFEITELPVRCWTQSYKESVLELLLHGNEKTSSLINDYKEYHTESTVRFVVTLPDTNLQRSLNNGLHKTFKLQSSLSTTSMVLFDHNGCLKRYETPEEILEEFYPVRLEFYVKRKAYYEGILEAEVLKLENQARFILEKNDGVIKMENVKKNDFIFKLIERKYDSDPVKAWKLKNGISPKEDDNNEQEFSDSEDTYETTSSQAMKNYKKYDFDYLIDMTMRSMLREKVGELLKHRDNKKEELDKLRRTTPEMLWEEDLKVFLEELEAVEEQERLAGLSSKPIKITAKGMAKIHKNKSNKLSFESKPSANADRVEPKIDFENYRKTEKVSKKVLEKKKKDGENSPEREPIDSDEDIGKPLSERIGVSPQIIDEKKSKAKNIKPSLITNLNTELEAEKPKKKRPVKKAETTAKKTKTANSKAKKKNPWSESESDEQDVNFIDSEDDEKDYVPINSSTRNIKPKNVSNEESIVEKDDLISFNTTSAYDIDYDSKSINKVDDKKKTIYDSDDDIFSSAKPVVNTNKRTSEELFDAIITKNDNEHEPNDVQESNFNRFTNNANDSDEELNNGKQNNGKLETIFENKPTKASKKAFDSDSDEDFAKPKPKSKPTKASKKAFDLDDDFEKPKPKPKAKTSKPKKKKIDSDSEEEIEKPKKKKVFISHYYSLLLTIFNINYFINRQRKPLILVLTTVSKYRLN